MVFANGIQRPEGQGIERRKRESGVEQGNAHFGAHRVSITFGDASNRSTPKHYCIRVEKHSL
jgi:hypothetical protein